MDNYDQCQGKGESISTGRAIALAFDAFVLSRSLGRKISFGKIIHGYDHSLKALAIRERKIHIVGSPELKMEGTPVYLDVEGLPDRDFSFPDWLGRPRK